MTNIYNRRKTISGKVIGNSLLVNKLKAKYHNDYDLFINAISLPKNERDSLLIKECILPYLCQLQPFLEFINNETNPDKFDNNLKRIIQTMSIEYIDKNKIFTSKVDKNSENFYLILKGKLACLVPYKDKMSLTEDLYINYLIKLRYLNEIELLSETILYNKSLIRIDDDFDSWLKRNIQFYENYLNNCNYSNNLNTNNNDNNNNDIMINKINYIGTENKKHTINTYNKIIKMYNALLEKIENKNEKYNIVTPEEYLSLSNLEDENYQTTSNRYLLTIFSYILTTIYIPGQFFSHSTNLYDVNKRKETVITLEDCIIGKFSKEDYVTYLKELYDKLVNSFINIIYKYPLFSYIDKKSFESKYYYMFRYKKINRDEYLMEEGEKNDKIMFIKNGEICISINKNLIEINELIIKLKKSLLFFMGNHKKYKNDKNKRKNNSANKNNKINVHNQSNSIDNLVNEQIEETENKEFILNKDFHLPQQNEIIFNKKKIKISLIKDSDILGFSNSVYILDNNFGTLFNYKCVSHCCEYLCITRQSMDLIIKCEDRVYSQYVKFNINKIKYILKRLYEYKDSTYQLIKKCYETNKLKNNNFKAQIKIVKGEKNKFHFTTVKYSLLSKSLPKIKFKRGNTIISKNLSFYQRTKNRIDDESNCSINCNKSCININDRSRNNNNSINNSKDKSNSENKNRYYTKNYNSRQQNQKNYNNNILFHSEFKSSFSGISFDDNKIIDKHKNKLIKENDNLSTLSTILHTKKTNRNNSCKLINERSLNNISQFMNKNNNNNSFNIKSNKKFIANNDKKYFIKKLHKINVINDYSITHDFYLDNTNISFIDPLIIEKLNKAYINGNLK